MSATSQKVDSSRAYDLYLGLVKLRRAPSSVPSSAQKRKRRKTGGRHDQVFVSRFGIPRKRDTERLRRRRRVELPSGFLTVIPVPGVTTGTNFSFDISAVDG